MPLSCVQEWRARTGSCWCVLGRPAKCRSPFRGKESQPSQTSSFTTFFLILLSAMNFGMILDLINATCHLLNWSKYSLLKNVMILPQGIITYTSIIVHASLHRCEYVDIVGHMTCDQFRSSEKCALNNTSQCLFEGT